MKSVLSALPTNATIKHYTTVSSAKVNLADLAMLSTARDVKRVMDQGATAAMLGTRFVATIEANAHQAYKQALVEATSVDTAFTNCFDIDCLYAMVRVLRNRTFLSW